MRLTRTTREAFKTAQRGGGHLGRSLTTLPRRDKLTMDMAGSGRQHMGMGQATAPYKHQMGLFKGNNGLSTNMGMEGPEEGLPP